jgi:hypothetical protein
MQLHQQQRMLPTAAVTKPSPDQQTLEVGDGVGLPHWILSLSGGGAREDDPTESISTNSQVGHSFSIKKYSSTAPTL